MKELFVVTSYHHMLTAIAKKFKNNSKMDILISNMSSGDEYWFKYIDKIKEANVLDNIYFIAEKKYHPPKGNRIFATYYYEFFGEKKILKQIKGFDPLQYDMTYLIDDKMFLGSTIVRNNRPYHLCEDTAFTYYALEKSKVSKILNSPYLYMKGVFELLNYWHLILGYAPCCKAIETSTLEGLPKMLPNDKLLLVDRKGLINSIPKDIKEKILRIFLPDDIIITLKGMEDSVMILTSVYRVNIDYDEQREVCKRIADRFAGAHIIIKPHPRDTTDYNGLIKDATIIDRSFPTEILNYVDSFKVNTIASIHTTAADTCDFAENKVKFTFEDIGLELNFYK